MNGRGPGGVVPLIVLLAMTLLAGAQSRPRSVPPTLPDPPRAELVANHEALMARRSELSAAVQRHNTECSGVRPNTAQAEHCRTRQLKLDREIADYTEAVGAFNAALAAALERAESEPRIDRSLAAERAQFGVQLSRLLEDIDGADEPAVTPPLRLHEALMLGLFDPAGGAREKYAEARSPFTGRPYENGTIFATTAAADANEALRGLLDNHHLGAYTLNTPQGRRLIAQLRGAHIDRLIAHSNGATIAEALIRRGVMQVDELNIVGGDRSMVNHAGLQELLRSGRVRRVVVWMNPGDIIPLGSSATLVSPFGPTGSLPVATTAQLLARALMGANESGDARVEYPSLAGSDYVGQEMKLDESFFNAHSLKDAYLVNMARFLNRQP